MKIYTQTSLFNADRHTPVELYLSLRDRYRKPCLLESNDYHSRQQSKSFIGLDPIVEISLNGHCLTINEGEGVRNSMLNSIETRASQIQSILDQYIFDQTEFNGFFGRMGFEFNYPDETRIKVNRSDLDLPVLHLFIFRYVIVIDHFTSQGYVLENNFKPVFDDQTLKNLLKPKSFPVLPFERTGHEKASISDDSFKDLVLKGIEHCKRGDVFQLVLSNAFEQPFFGDEFQVYRQLRRLNPSPYLFYFDFESYRLFGSSPEAQLVIRNGKAEIHPIAGTVPKTGDRSTDAAQLKHLINDEKENAEHTMLVDLARNDLSRDCLNVKVESYKEIQHFSHVMHMVSKVTGKVKTKNAFETFCHSFPAGTLSGTPKPKALELIHHYENSSRDFYGGSIGMFGANNDVNMAIVIRSILSKNNILHYRAGAGVVLDSKPEMETNEVHHKLRAVRRAIENAHFDSAQCAFDSDFRALSSASRLRSMSY